MSASENNQQEAPADGIRDLHASPPAYFNLLFYGLIVWGVIFSAYYLLSGWSSTAEFEQKMATHLEETSGKSPAPAGQ